MPEEAKSVEKTQENQSEIKFTEEEMQKVKDIQSSYVSIQNRFGQLKMAQIRYDEQGKTLSEQNEKLEQGLKEIQAGEQKFLDDINKKYGQGTLNPETGIFTAVPTENKSK